MIRIFAKSVLASAAILAAAGVSAAPRATYVATPVAAPTKNHLITRDTAWQVRDGAYVATNAPVREMIACQLVAQNAGALTSFSVNGEAFDGAELESCNAKAKGGKAMVTKAAATQVPAN
ncbi:hypothetical protein SAMN05428950_1012019 [Sphingomonas sp. OV641]|jgi:hypothetical protein|uniref:CC_3452 family protein n=1 Tax=unclassified Sphingomonas TaxID=196159 RepID=UPI00082A2BC8|nr:MULTISPECIES: hypothetical protein [unclassified Sphingomonas]SEJ37766.1 hypothetical protein SAMN05428950_1012019 [Sphingomonas sp. OV641]